MYKVSTTMPSRCVAAECGSISVSKETSVFTFPTEKKYKNLWINFVKTKRKWNYTENSVLCSKHFTEGCFDGYLKWKMGFKKCLNIRKDAIPTIHASECVSKI